MEKRKTNHFPIEDSPFISKEMKGKWTIRRLPDPGSCPRLCLSFCDCPSCPFLSVYPFASILLLLSVFVTLSVSLHSCLSFCLCPFVSISLFILTRV